MDSNETSFQFKLGEKLAFVEIYENKLFKVNPKDVEQNLKQPVSKVNEMRLYLDKFYFNRLFWT